MAVGKRAVPADPHTLNDVFEAEQALVGLILSDPGAYGRIAGILQGDDWTERLHRGVFEVAGELSAAGRAMTLPAILPRVSDVAPDGTLPELYLATLIGRAPPAGSAPGFAHFLVAAADERRLANRFPDYEADLYAWAFRQAERLRRGQWSDLDALNLAEEIEDLGNEIYNKLESAFRITLMHMLKWDHQPSRRSRSWTLSIRNGRLDVEKVLERSKGVRPRVPAAVAEAYRRARIDAAGETDLDESMFPEVCPYSFDEIMSRPVPWPPAP